MQNDDRIFGQTQHHLGFQVIDVADFHRLEIDGSISVEVVHRPLMTLAENRSDGQPKNVFALPNLDRPIDPITVTKPLPEGGRVGKVQNDIDLLLLYPERRDFGETIRLSLAAPSVSR